MDDHMDTKPQRLERTASMWPLVTLMVLAAALLYVVQARRAGPPQTGLGQPLPPLLVAGWLNTDQPPTLDDLRGQVVLVDCWASWCGPCVRHMPELVDLYEQFRDQGLIVIGLTPERGEELVHVRAFVTRTQGLGWPIAYGADIPLDTMGIEGFPTYTLFDRSGRSVWSDHSLRGLDAVIAAELAKPVPPADGSAEPTATR